MFGAYVAGIMIKHGRRKVLLFGSLIGIVGVAITIYQQLWSIILGRLIYGFSCGLLAVSMPRLMEETIPGELVGFFGGLYCVSFAVAVLIAFGMALFLPPDSDPEALASSPVIQIIFGLPIVFYLIQLFIQMFYLQSDSPKFLII